MIYSFLWLIRATTTTLQEWDIGLGCPLPKYNKPSCLGLRLIHLLDILDNAGMLLCGAMPHQDLINTPTGLSK
eukprot:9408840-Heterocapsa_arctica.AAC.1